MSYFYLINLGMESYLNIAPWGPGIDGAEAASRYFFKKARTS